MGVKQRCPLAPYLLHNWRNVKYHNEACSKESKVQGIKVVGREKKNKSFHNM